VGYIGLFKLGEIEERGIICQGKRILHYIPEEPFSGLLFEGDDWVKTRGEYWQGGGVRIYFVEEREEARSKCSILTGMERKHLAEDVQLYTIGGKGKTVIRDDGHPRKKTRGGGHERGNFKKGNCEKAIITMR